MQNYYAVFLAIEVNLSALLSIFNLVLAFFGPSRYNYSQTTEKSKWDWRGYFVSDKADNAPDVKYRG